MKNGGRILLMICLLSAVLIFGIYLGRSSDSEFVFLAENKNDTDKSTLQAQTDFRLDINSATKVQLMELPGVGETTAERIIEYRTQNGGFSSTDELMDVEGIGEKKLLQIEHLIKAGG